MSEKQTNAEKKAVAALELLGAEIVWLGGVDSVYVTKVRITDADLKHFKGLTSLKKLKLNPVFYSMNLYLLLFQRVTATQVPCGTRRQVFVKHRVSCLG